MNDKEITERVRAIYDHLRKNGVTHSKRGFLSPLGLRDSYISGILNPDSATPYNLPTKYYDAFIKKYSVNPDYFYFGTEPMFVDTNKQSETNMKLVENNSVQANARLIGEIFPGAEETQFRDLGNGELLMLVPKVDKFTMAGYLEHIQDNEWIESLPVENLIVDKTHRGRYLAFDIIGESMTDGTDRSIPHGASVIGREIKREVWYPKFHTHKWDEYIIVLKNYMVVKAIKNQDFKNGTIVLESYNPDKDTYPDETINIDDILEVFNVIEVRVKRRR